MRCLVIRKDPLEHTVGVCNKLMEGMDHEH